jgi:hypothetical protein
MRGIRSDGHSTAGKVGDTAGGDRGRVSDAVVAERARFRHFERTECLAVATRTRSEPMNEISSPCR